MAALCDLVPCVCIFLSFVIFYNLISWKTSKLPPGPVGLPVVGSLFQIGDMPNESLAKLSKQYGPLMSLRLGLTTTVVVSSAEMAEEVLQKHDQDFAGRTVMDAVNVCDYPESSIIMNQNCRREIRRVCNNELFVPKKLEAMRGCREEKVRVLLKHIHTASVAGHPVNIGQCVFKMALNLMSSTVFSEDVVDLESEESMGEFQGVVWGLIEAVRKPNVADYFPMLRLVDPQGRRRRVRTLTKQKDALLHELIKKRSQSHGSAAEGWKKEREDFLDVLLRLVETPNSGFTIQNIRPIITKKLQTYTFSLFLICDGHLIKALVILVHLTGPLFGWNDTSSITVEWAMTELLRHPNKMAAAQSELKRTVGMDCLVQESDIPRLPYLQAVVKETLRLHPPAPLLIPHRADVTKRVGGFTIPKHTQVLVNAWAIARDASYWENPTSFLPERFISSNIDSKGKNFHFIPFGAGRRMCVGMALGQRMVHLVLASLLQAFSWELPQGIEPERVNVEAKFGITLHKAVPLIVFPSPLMDM
ncbi:Steroid 17-alpha-hydroxylase/17-20 lyase [Nymphaea thermarum]|nr:Steroid 17-alpha-hydroxylase/17-20 lyase [Nymphaea thermarum]